MDSREVLSREARRPDAVLTYGAHPEHLIDVHLPPRPLDSTEPAPVVVFLHGGFWRQEYDRTHTRPLAQALSAVGYVVITPEFRRSGGAGGYPETFDDVATALSAVPRVDEIAPGRADLSDITLAGHSAGGHLAMWWVRRRGTGRPPVRHVVALAPVADLIEAHRRGLGDQAVDALMGGSPEELPEAYAAANPGAMPPGDVPVTVIHGTLDDRVPVDMSRTLEGVDLIELPEVDHFGLIDPLAPPYSTLLAAIGQR